MRSCEQYSASTVLWLSFRNQGRISPSASEKWECWAISLEESWGDASLQHVTVPLTGPWGLFTWEWRSITYVELTEVTEWKNAFQALLLLFSSYPLGCLGKDAFSQWRCSSHGCLAGLDTHWCHILDSLLSLFSSVSSIRDTPETQERRSIYSWWWAYPWGIIWWEPKGSLKNNRPAARHGSLNHHYWGRGHCVVLWKETWDTGTEPMSSSQSTLQHYLSGITAEKDFNHLCSFLCF